MNQKTSLRSRLLAAPYLVWSAIFIIAPTFFVAYYAFTDSTGAFTTENLSNLSRYTDTILLSVWLGLIATLICLVIAYPLAYIISQTSPTTQRTLIMLLMLPMWMSFLIRTYAWMNLLQDTGIINNLLGMLGIGPFHMINTQGAVILGMVYNYLPYMVLPLYSVMSKMDRSLIEASQDLGASRLRVLQKVILPMSLPGIISGFTMVFVPSVSTFYISKKLGGKISLVGDAIESLFLAESNYNLGAMLSLVLMVLILLSMALMRRFSAQDDQEVLL